MGVNLVFLMEVILHGNQITAKVMTSLAMSKQNGLTNSDGFSLTLKSIIGITAFNNPLSIVRVNSMQRSFLVTSNSLVFTSISEDSVCLRSAANVKYFLVKPLVGLNLNFLTETNGAVTAIDVLFFYTADNIDVSGNRTTLVL